MAFQKESEVDLIGKILFDKYSPISQIGEGSFGKLYLAKDIKTNEKLALKFERKRDNNNLLKKEAYTMVKLKHSNIPKVYSFGTTNQYHVLAMELLGDSLETAFNKCDKKMSLKSACMIGIEMIKTLSFIHSKGVLHRDLKPDNFMFGRGSKANKLYLIDFGLSKEYVDDKNQHVPVSYGKKLVGTARYASLNTHKGVEQGRRDDLESVGYILIYLIKGILPWQGLKVKSNEDHYTKIFDKKQEVRIRDLCSNLPLQFSAYIDYCRKLGYSEEPNYDYLIKLFSAVLEEKYKIVNIENDYEWIKKTLRFSMNNEEECDNSNVNKQISNNRSNNNRSNNNNVINNVNNNTNNINNNIINKNTNLLSMIMNNKSMNVVKSNISNNCKSENPSKMNKQQSGSDDEVDRIYQLDDDSIK